MFLNAMYGGLGQSVGALLGGKLQSMVGTVRMFLYAGTFDLCFVAFLIVYLMRNQDSSFRNPKPIEARTSTTTTTATLKTTTPPAETRATKMKESRRSR